MQLTVNYSPQASDLFRAGAIALDVWKCSDWPELIAGARATGLPHYFHFDLHAGPGNVDEVGDLDHVAEAIAERTHVSRMSWRGAGHGCLTSARPIEPPGKRLQVASRPARQIKGGGLGEREPARGLALPHVEVRLQVIDDRVEDVAPAPGAGTDAGIEGDGIGRVERDAELLGELAQEGLQPGLGTLAPAAEERPLAGVDGGVLTSQVKQDLAGRRVVEESAREVPVHRPPSPPS